MTMNHIDKLAWIHIQDKQLLGTRSKGIDTYYIPGGKRQAGESDEQALVREIKEELNVSLLPKTLQLFGQFEAQAHGKPEGVMVKMTCYYAQYEGEIEASCEIEEVYWLKHKDREMTSAVDKIILDALKNQALID
jgi:8-oxo-dGTP diphosphatase